MKRKKFLSVGCLFLVVLLASTSISLAAPKKEIGPPPHAQTPPFAPPCKWKGTLEVLSPRGALEPLPNSPISPRVTDLTGKKIGLYDNGKQGLTAFFDVVQQLLLQRYPTVTIKRYYGAFLMPDQQAAQIAAEVDTFILGVAD
jgi:hypothetical protein